MLASDPAASLAGKVNTAAVNSHFQGDVVLGSDDGIVVIDSSPRQAVEGTATFQPVAKVQGMSECQADIAVWSSRLTW